MTLSFDPKSSLARVQAARWQTWLAHPLLALSIPSLLISALLTYIFQAYALSLMTLSLASALSLVWLFALTYLRDYPRKFTTSNFDHKNLALIADNQLILEARRLQSLTPASLAINLISHPSLAPVWNRLEISPSQVSTTLAPHLQSLDWSWWGPVMLNVAKVDHDPKLTILHALSALVKYPDLKHPLRAIKLKPDDIQFATWWISHQRRQHRFNRAWWLPENILAFQGLGLAWTSGFTPLVDQLARLPQGSIWDQIVPGRSAQVEQLLTTLARQQQGNVLLTGQPGVGRMGLVKSLAERLRTGQVHPKLSGKAIRYLNLGELFASQSLTRQEDSNIISRLLREMELAGNIIAVVDGLSSLISDTNHAFNFTDALLPFFNSSQVQVVVILSSQDYHLHVKNNSEITHLFEVIQISSASPQVTLQSLALAAPYLEKTSGYPLNYPLLETLVRHTQGVLQDIPYPERAFDTLDELIAEAQGKGLKTLTSQLVDQLIERKTGVPVAAADSEESARLLNLEEHLKRRVINQRIALQSVSQALIRARAGVRDSNQPLGTFLFLGPTGVGKTETAKALAASYFKSEANLRRLDMSEFQTPDSIGTLIGTPQNPVGRLTSLAIDHPFSVFLFDEFEKAHTSVHQLFLQILDEGRLTDARGHTVSFRHSILIATSNAGAELIRQHVKAGQVPDNFEATLREHILTENIYRPELLNRFDGVITFTPLSPDHVRQIARLMLKNLNARLDTEHGLTVAITEELVTYLADIGYDPEFGARPLKRAIQNTVEQFVAQQILSGSLRVGDTLTLTPQQLSAVQPKP